MNIKRYLGKTALLLITALAIVAGTTLLVSYAPAVSPTASVAARFWSVVNSNIFIATISTFAAAFAGAWGAQFIAERGAKRKVLLDEIRSASVAIGLTFNIANTYLSTKKQRIQSFCKEYEQQSEARTNHESMIQNGMPVGPFDFKPNLRADPRSWDSN